MSPGERRTTFYNYDHRNKKKPKIAETLLKHTKTEKQKQMKDSEFQIQNSRYSALKDG
jgi:hypothetical protein